MNEGWKGARILAVFLSILTVLTLDGFAATGPAPMITVQPQSLTVPLLGIATFSVTASSQTTMSYQWFFNSNAIAGANSSSYTVLTVLGSSSGTYFVNVTNASGVTTSSNAYLNVVPPPVIASQPQSEAVNQGQNASFSVTATGSGLSYQWYFNGSSMSGQTAATLNLKSVNPNVAGNYDVVVSNTAGAVTSSIVTLTVYSTPTIQSQPQNQTVVQGANVLFSVSASGLALAYQWYLNGSPIPTATSSNLSLLNVQSNQSGSYSVVVANPAGSATSQSASLTVDVPALVMTQPTSVAVLAGQNATFSVQGAGTAPLNYQWYFNGANIGPNNASLSLNNVTPNNAGSYYAVVQNSWGSATSSVVNLTVNVPAAIQSPPTNLSVVLGHSAVFGVLAAGTAPLTYQWFFNGVALPGAVNASLSLSDVQTAQAGNYSVQVSNGFGSTNSPVAALTVIVPPSITTQPVSQSVNQGANASFSVAVAGSTPSYQWYFNNASMGNGQTSPTLTLNSVNPNVAGNYFVVVSNSGGAVTSSIATLTVYTAPTIQSQPQNQTVVQGTNVSFSVSASGLALAYQWFWNGSVIPGATSSNLSLLNVQSNQTGSYSVVVTNPAGTVTSGSAALTVNVPAFIVVQPQSQFVTNGQNVTLSVVANGTAPLRYSWYFGNSSITNQLGSESSSVTINNFNSTNVGRYAVLVNNDYGTVLSSIVFVGFQAPPVITNQPQSVTALAGQPAVFTVGASSPVPESYSWFFNGAPLSGATNSSLAFSSVSSPLAGNYCAVVSNSFGCVTSSVVTLTVPISISVQTTASGAPQGGTGLTPNGFAMQLSVPVGRTYVVLATTNLLNWTPIETNVSLTGSVSFLDTDAVNHPSRMYRILVR